jgi:hypothetical protein
MMKKTSHPKNMECRMDVKLYMGHTQKEACCFFTKLTEGENAL